MAAVLPLPGVITEEPKFTVTRRHNLLSGNMVKPNQESVSCKTSFPGHQSKSDLPSQQIRVTVSSRSETGMEQSEIPPLKEFRIIYPVI